MKRNAGVHHGPGDQDLAAGGGERAAAWPQGIMLPTNQTMLIAAHIESA